MGLFHMSGLQAFSVVIEKLQKEVLKKKIPTGISPWVSACFTSMRILFDFIKSFRFRTAYRALIGWLFSTGKSAYRANVVINRFK